MEKLTWQYFREQLEANTTLFLQFQYEQGKWVNAAYHITEIKQAPITSVDCGGLMNNWTEIIIQLWEPTNEVKEQAMQVSKALSIIELVEKSLKLDADGIVKIEFGNAGFATRQMLPKNLIVNGENLIIDLSADTIQCKAIERGGSCGTNEKGEECCTTQQETEKPNIKLVNLAEQPACAPGSGCC